MLSSHWACFFNDNWLLSTTSPPSLISLRFSELSHGITVIVRQLLQPLVFSRHSVNNTQSIGFLSYIGSINNIFMAAYTFLHITIETLYLGLVGWTAISSIIGHIIFSVCFSGIGHCCQNCQFSVIGPSAFVIGHFSARSIVRFRPHSRPLSFGYCFSFTNGSFQFSLIRHNCCPMLVISLLITYFNIE